jgi:Domain of unknown function (DUF5071)
MVTDYHDCVPKNKHDIAAVQRARAVGFPELNSVIPSLLEWMQDGNWPVAMEIAELLQDAGSALDAPLLVILKSDDAIWKYWAIILLVSRLPRPTSSELIGELRRIALTPTRAEKVEGVDEEAASVLTLKPFSSY